MTIYKKIKKINNIRTWKIIIKFDIRQITIMINNDATNNFISKKLIKILNLSTQFKKNVVRINCYKQKQFKKKTN